MGQSIKEKMADLAKKVDSLSKEEVVSQLFNFCETVIAENDALKKKHQKSLDEINRLKGEKGKPNIRKQPKDKGDISSESERNKNKNEKKKPKKKKKANLKITQTEVLEVNKDDLPPDAVFKGYKTEIVQHLEIVRHNIEYRKAIYYSPSLKKTFMADLPPGQQGDYTPGVKSLITSLHYAGKMTHSAILQFLKSQDVDISAASVSRILTDNIDVFHQEKENLVTAGLASSIFQQMDDTGAKVKGKNYYTHILCNDFYTAYFTKPHKDRLTIIDILTQGKTLFKFNELAYALMEQMKVPEKFIVQLRAKVKKELMNRDEADALLKEIFPDLKKQKNNRKRVLEAGAITAYQETPGAIEILLSDDAPQFKLITKLLALCWVHDGRHYKKLNPVIPQNRKKLDDFLTKYWDFYHKLLEYKKQPTPELANVLEEEFDTLFSTETGYDLLDDRIKKTFLKKEFLLLVLKYPSLPLHNNTSELGARVQARYRDVSLHTMTPKGTEAKDSLMTTVETCKKLGVNPYDYIHDRVSQKNEMPSLASLITAKANAERQDSG